MEYFKWFMNPTVRVREPNILEMGTFEDKH